MEMINGEEKFRPRLSSEEFEFIKQLRALKEKAYGRKEEDGDTLEVESNLSVTLEDLVKEHNVDLNIWEPVKFEPGGYTTPVKMSFRHEDTQNNINYNAKLPVIIKNKKTIAVFKKRTQIIDYEKFRRELVDDIKRFSPTVPKIQKNKDTSGNLLEINIPDLHLGKMGWGEETGEPDYDLKIAVQRFKDALEYMISEVYYKYKIDRVLFIVGNDLFNSDNDHPYSMTTRGTPQENDTRWQKIFRVGRNLMIDSIDILKNIAPVDVITVFGNHDHQKSFYLSNVLEARFYNDDNVVVYNSPKTRKYYKWGKCGLGFTHGNRKDEGEQRLVHMMQDESGFWDDTIYREWHCGDIHHYKEIQAKSTSKAIDKYAEDVGGVVIKYLRTLMFNDEWEARKGFNSQKGAHCFIWNKEDGNIAEIKYNKI